MYWNKHIQVAKHWKSKNGIRTFLFALFFFNVLPQLWDTYFSYLIYNLKTNIAGMIKLKNYVFIYFLHFLQGNCHVVKKFQSFTKYDQDLKSSWVRSLLRAHVSHYRGPAWNYEFFFFFCFHSEDSWVTNCKMVTQCLGINILNLSTLFDLFFFFNYRYEKSSEYKLSPFREAGIQKWTFTFMEKKNPNICARLPDKI